MSSTTSFVAVGVLASTGIATLMASTSDKQLLFASIPFLFSLQQLSEGFVWISVLNPGPQPNMLAIYTFLVFAQIIWPLLVPLSLIFLERQALRKNLLFLCLGIGILFSSYFLYCLLTFPINVSISHNHIKYRVLATDTPFFLSSIAYFIPTVISLFISGHPLVKLLGYTVLASFIFTVLYFNDSLISVWCFFAGIGSISVYFIIKGKQHTGFSEDLIPASIEPHV